MHFSKFQLIVLELCTETFDFKLLSLLQPLTKLLITSVISGSGSQCMYLRMKREIFSLYIYYLWQYCLERQYKGKDCAIVSPKYQIIAVSHKSVLISNLMKM